MKTVDTTPLTWLFPGIVALFILIVAAFKVYGELGIDSILWMLLLIIVLIPVALISGIRAGRKHRFYRRI